MSTAERGEREEGGGRGEGKSGPVRQDGVAKTLALTHQKALSPRFVVGGRVDGGSGKGKYMEESDVMVKGKGRGRRRGRGGGCYWELLEQAYMLFLRR